MDRAMPPKLVIGIEFADVQGRPILIPQHSVRTMPERKETGISAATRSAHSFASIINPNRHRDSVTGKRTKSPHLDRLRTPLGAKSGREPAGGFPS